MSNKLFFFIVATFVMAICSINLVPLQVGLFAPENRSVRGILAKLPAADVAGVKLFHGTSNKPFDVAVFGNSRALMLSATSLALSEDAFFNFSIGGQSFRQSVKMLKDLSASGKAPRIAILSFDHVALGLPGGHPVTPMILGRISDRLLELIEMMRRGVNIRSQAVFIWNTIVSELNRTQSAISWPAISTRAALLAHPIIPLSVQPHFLQEDGSEKEILPAEKLKIVWKHPPRADQYLLLEHDLKSLEDIAQNGTRILIYESPLELSISAKIEEGLTENAQSVRERLFRECLARNLECYQSPRLDGAKQGVFWRDSDHPPSLLLAGWLRERLLN